MTANSKTPLSIPNHLLILAMSMLLCGLIALMLGRDVSWDLANYHYSNAYLFLHHTPHQDFWPASYVHAYFVPTADLLTYFLIHTFSPFSATFIAGAIHGINLWLIFLIARLFIPTSFFIPLIMAFIGMYGGVGYWGIGDFRNDHVVSLFVLVFVFCQIRLLQLYHHVTPRFKRGIQNSWTSTTGSHDRASIVADFRETTVILSAAKDHLQNEVILRYAQDDSILRIDSSAPKIRNKAGHGSPLAVRGSILSLLFVAGVSLGIALGMKLTCAGYVAAGFTTYLFLNIPWRDRLMMILFLGISVTIGLLISSGYWMWFLWKEYHNPFFPFLNSLFHSPDFVSTNLHYTQYLPKTVLATLFYPFYFSLHGTLADNSFSDMRYFYLYLLLIGTGFVALRKKIFSSSFEKLDLATSWLISFTIFTYIFCQYQFGSIRYMLAIEMLAPLLIYLLIHHLVSSTKLKNILVTFIYLTVVISLTPEMSQTRVKNYHNSYFNVTPPSLTKNTADAIVLIPYSEFALYSEPRPLTFLTAFFPNHWRFVGIPFAHQLYDLSDLNTTVKINQFISHSSANIYLLSAEKNMNELYRSALQFNLLPAGECSKVDNIRSELLEQKTLLCPVQRILTA